MGERELAGEDATPLMQSLASKDGRVRLEAREALVALGEAAVSPLTEALEGARSVQLRWEAAKALGAIRSPSSIESLVKALEDKDRDVAWLAANALIEFGLGAWPALFRALIKDEAKSPLLRQGAHHVLCKQGEAQFDDLLPALLKALESNAVREAALVAANEIYRRLSTGPTS